MVTSLGATIVSLLFISMVSYLKNFGNYNTGEITYLTTISMIAYLSCMALMGALSDFIGRVKFLTIGVVFLAIFIVPFYELINLHGNLLSMTVSFFVLGVISGVITGTFPSVIAGIFPTNIRYTGVAISFNVGFAFFGGLSPLFASMFNPIYLVWLSCLLCFIGLKLISNESRIITFGKVI
ncbi:MFS transporter [Paraphotobacterium marinum]|uniref:MFS transporter n=1 Tax=Paraphotobacterium marinum TaxID=1755811 RepID=UPI0013141D5A|nr:MFS transporter [Paraphotobacterium marinum]